MKRKVRVCPQRDLDEMEAEKWPITWKNAFKYAGNPKFMGLRCTTYHVVVTFSPYHGDGFSQIPDLNSHNFFVLNLFSVILICTRRYYFWWLGLYTFVGSYKLLLLNDLVYILLMHACDCYFMLIICYVMCMKLFFTC